jgi:hypothetical protein
MTTTATTTTAIDEVGALVTTLFATPADQLTNCAGWTAHDLVAHLAAGAAEQADLIEEHLAGAPERATRTFTEREAPYRALPDDELRERLVVEAARFGDLQARLGTDAVPFTGRPMTAADFAMHSRSECALHRWDLVGRDEIGWAMLGQEELTRHALTVLGGMASLAEAPSQRAHTTDLPDGTALVIRSEPHDDVTMTRRAGTVQLELTAPAGPAHLEMEPAARLLVLWGRREPSAPARLVATGPTRTLAERLLAPA